MTSPIKHFLLGITIFILFILYASLYCKPSSIQVVHLPRLNFYPNYLTTHHTYVRDFLYFPNYQYYIVRVANPRVVGVAMNYYPIFLEDIV